MNLQSPGGLNVEGFGFGAKELVKAGQRTKRTVFWSEQPTHVMHCKSVRKTMSKRQSPISEETSGRGYEAFSPPAIFQSERVSWAQPLLQMICEYHREYGSTERDNSSQLTATLIQKSEKSFFVILSAS